MLEYSGRLRLEWLPQKQQNRKCARVGCGGWAYRSKFIHLRLFLQQKLLLAAVVFPTWRGPMTIWNPRGEMDVKRRISLSVFSFKHIYNELLLRLKQLLLNEWVKILSERSMSRDFAKERQHLFGIRFHWRWHQSRHLDLRRSLPISSHSGSPW